MVYIDVEKKKQNWERGREGGKRREDGYGAPDCHSYLQPSLKHSRGEIAASSIHVAAVQ